MKTFVIGDIHGAHKALDQCLERSKFDRSRDRLICLGDVCDGYPEVHKCIDELLTLKHCDFILGNHDLWSLEWARQDVKPADWVSQGGGGTMSSYEQGMPKAHVEFLANARPWIEEGRRFFVHGGFNPDHPIAEQSIETFVWDRTLIMRAQRTHQSDPGHKYSKYDEIYVGHTPTTLFGEAEPQQFCNLHAVDTGAGWGGRLTIMDIDTKKFHQSDPTLDLYPGVRARRR